MRDVILKKKEIYQTVLNTSISGVQSSWTTLYSGVEEPFYYLANEYHKLHGERAENMANVA